MRAAICTGYGAPDMVRIGEVEKPIPKRNEVLIRIHATTVSAGDRRIRGLDMPPGFGLLARPILGFSRPRKPVLGTDLAGVVEAVGADVRAFKPGDRVFALAGMRMGCHAEYAVLPENGAIALKPANLSFEEAVSLVFGGTTALDYLKTKAKLQPGEHVLIIGATGAVGSAALQIAKALGAHVTAVCGADKGGLARALGADEVIDYTKEDFRNRPTRYDVIMDNVGVLSFKARAFLTAGGRLLLMVASLPQMLQAPLYKNVITGVAAEKADDLLTLKTWAESGALRPVIGAVFAFDDIVAAHTCADGKHKTGAVVVRIEEVHR